MAESYEAFTEADEPRAERQVSGEVQILREEVDRLTTTVSKLEKSLNEVLRQPDAEKEAAGLAPVQPRVPLADNLHTQSRNLADQTDRIIRIMGRLEL